MRKLTPHTVLFVLMVLVTGINAAPGKPIEKWNIDDVLGAVADANGGMESIESVTNARFMGRVEGSDSSYEFVIMKRRPNRIRSRLIMEEEVFETGYDGEVVWRRYEKDAFNRVERVEDPEFVSNMRIEADFDGPLIGPAEEGVSRRLVGIERIDRVDHFVVEVKRPLQVALHYIDSRTLREMQVVRTINPDSGNPEVIVSRFHDLQNHNGIWVAMRVVKEFKNGETEVVLINSVEMNLGILDFSFKMPDEKS